MKKETILKNCIVAHAFFTILSFIFAFKYLEAYALNYTTYSIIGTGAMYLLFIKMDPPIPIRFEKIILYPSHCAFVIEFFPPVATFVSLGALYYGIARIPLEYILPLFLGMSLADLKKLRAR